MPIIYRLAMMCVAVMEMFVRNVREYKCNTGLELAQDFGIVAEGDPLFLCQGIIMLENEKNKAEAPSCDRFIDDVFGMCTVVSVGVADPRSIQKHELH